jgi:hypothetical protein
MQQTDSKLFLADIVVHATWWFAHFLVFGGVFLILHQALVTFASMTPVLSQWFVESLATIFSTLSLFFVSISVYFEGIKRTAPTDMTKRFSAPAMAIAAIVFLLIFLWSGSLHSDYVDALAAIALGGAIMRLTGVPLRST